MPSMSKRPKPMGQQKMTQKGIGEQAMQFSPQAMGQGMGGPGEAAARAMDMGQPSGLQAATQRMQGMGKQGLGAGMGGGSQSSGQPGGWQSSGAYGAPPGGMDMAGLGSAMGMADRQARATSSSMGMAEQAAAQYGKVAAPGQGKQMQRAASGQQAKPMQIAGGAKPPQQLPQMAARQPGKQMQTAASGRPPQGNAIQMAAAADMQRRKR